MIRDSDRAIIKTICQKYRVSKAILFGSSLNPEQAARDIDLAVDGLAPQDYYRFYGELICSLSMPVDVVNLAGESKFVSIIKQTGMLLYG